MIEIYSFIMPAKAPIKQFCSLIVYYLETVVFNNRGGRNTPTDLS